MYKKSNFARTQKAIKMIREGPLRGKGKLRDDTTGGHFMKLNDYAALHGMLAPGDPNQQHSQPHLVRPELASEMSTSSYLLGITGMKDFKNFSSTAYIVKPDNEEQHHVTLVSEMQKARQQ